MIVLRNILHRLYVLLTLLIDVIISIYRNLKNKTSIKMSADIRQNYTLQSEENLNLIINQLLKHKYNYDSMVRALSFNNF